MLTLSPLESWLLLGSLIALVALFSAGALARARETEYPERPLAALEVDVDDLPLVEPFRIIPARPYDYDAEEI